MPPQPLSASSSRSFVCRSCLLLSRIPQQQAWISRGAIIGARRPKSNAVKFSGLEKRQIPPRTSVNYFDETPDGERTEMDGDPDVEAFMKVLNSNIEQLDDGGDLRLRSLLQNPDVGPGEPVRAQEDNDLAQSITAKLDALNIELELLKSRITSAPMGCEIPVMSAEDRSRLREAVLNIGTNEISQLSEDVFHLTAKTPIIPGKISLERIPRVPPNTLGDTKYPVATVPKVDKESLQIPLAYYSDDHRKHISALNSALRRASNKFSNGQWIGPQLHKEIWKYYLMCRIKLLSAPQGISLPVWKLLWRVFATRDEWNIDRTAHLRYLGGDMIRSGIALSDSQRLLFIKSIFMEGYREQAIKEWEIAERALNSNRDTHEEYWMLGVRLFCQERDVERAINAAEVLLHDVENPLVSRILIPIMQACLASSSDSSYQMAWALYIRLRLGLGRGMEMQDYDAVISLFLTANQQDLALGVFKDMMITGVEGFDGQDSVALYPAASKIAMKPASISFEEKELNWQDSRVLATLPPKFNNKYFFGKWIKKLLGDAELDAAKKVFDLMQDRGICPDPKHTNGLIGAWFRAGTSKSQALAEDLAWKMIRARIDFVETRDMHLSLNYPLTAVKSHGKPEHKSPTPIPKATIETFSLLIEQYRRRQKQDALLDLYRALGRAKVQPNSFFLNQLLKSGLRSHRSKWAWEIYNEVVRHRKVTPDYETFTCLWQIEKKEVDPVMNRDSKGENFPSCRALFAEMTIQTPRLLQSGDFPRELYDLIVLSFGLSDDQAGSAVALYALEQYFDICPADGTARSLVLQLARASQEIPGGHRVRRLNLNKTTKERVAQVTEMLRMIKEQRVNALLSQGIVFEELQGKEKSRQSLIILSTLLRGAVQARFGDGHGKSDVEFSQAAAEEMGVPNCAPWTV